MADVVIKRLANGYGWLKQKDTKVTFPTVQALTDKTTDAFQIKVDDAKDSYLLLYLDNTDASTEAGQTITFKKGNTDSRFALADFTVTLAKGEKAVIQLNSAAFMNTDGYIKATVSDVKVKLAVVETV